MSKVKKKSLVTKHKSVPKKAAVKTAGTPAVPVAAPRRLKVMVSSSVYHLFNEVHQICGYLNNYGYDVLNSDIGTIYPRLNENDITLEACLDAVEECDIFLGIISPFYGTSGYTHQEFSRAIQLNKPRRFICHRYVTFARQLLNPLRFTKARNGRLVPANFTIQRTSVMDDIRVIDMYEEAVQSRKPRDQWKYRWVQEYFYLHEALKHIEVLFADRQKVEADLANFNNA